jgi:hypothetical protein
MSDRPVLLVLDTSAILAYVQGSIHVGEPISEVADDGGVAGLPEDCLAEARWAIADESRLQMLINHEATEVISRAAGWTVLADAIGRFGLPDAAAAALVAAGSRCGVLTRRPDIYCGTDGDDSLAIPIPR